MPLRIHRATGFNLYFCRSFCGAFSCFGAFRFFCFGFVFLRYFLRSFPMQKGFKDIFVSLFSVFSQGCFCMVGACPQYLELCAAFRAKNLGKSRGRAKSFWAWRSILFALLCRQARALHKCWFSPKDSFHIWRASVWVWRSLLFALLRREPRAVHKCWFSPKDSVHIWRASDCYMLRIMTLFGLIS